MSREEIWTQQSVQEQIKEVLKDVGTILIEKNRKYGNSAIHPNRIFSKADPAEAIRVRIDDKINRIMNRQADENEDAVFDLTGYLILLQVYERLRKADEAF